MLEGILTEHVVLVDRLLKVTSASTSLNDDYPLDYHPSRNRSRNAFLSTFPTPISGKAVTKWTAAGA